MTPSESGGSGGTTLTLSKRYSAALSRPAVERALVDQLAADLRRSLCSLSGRRGVDPVEAAQMTGHSLAVWARSYAGSFAKAQRDEAWVRLHEHGFGAT